MKYILSLAAIIAVCSSFTFSHSDPTKHGPLLIIDTSSSNFGAVPDTGFALRAFSLSNGGDSALRILKVQPTCGCTIAELADSTLAPGRTTQLEVRLSAAHASGNFYKNILITSNSRADSVQWLKFYGHFVADSSEKAQR